MPDKFTRKQLFQHGLHLEWMRRGTWMQFGDDVDMSPEVAEIEQDAMRRLGGRWKISLAVDECEDCVRERKSS